MIKGQEVLENRSLWGRLAGAHFHLIERGATERQGIVEEVENRHTLRVRYYSWVDGSLGDGDDLICRLELEKYRFYSSASEMHSTFERQTRLARLTS